MAVFRFNWWRDEDNRNGAKAITDVLKVAVPAVIVIAIAVAGYFGLSGGKQKGAGDQNRPEIINCDSTFTQSGDGTQIQSCGSGDVAVDGQQGQDLISCNSVFEQDGAGNLIQNCGDGTVIIGLTAEKFFTELEKREKQIRADIRTQEEKLRDGLNRASRAEQRALVAGKKLLELQLSQVQSDMGNLEVAYHQTVEELKGLRQELNAYLGIVPEHRLEQAQHALFEGDRSAADALLAGVEDAAKDVVKTAADAAFLRGEIADQEVRWADAAIHYDRAARYTPRLETLLKAQEFVWRAGDYNKAMRYGTDLIRLAKTSKNQLNLATALNNQAVMLRETGQYDAAEPLFREALQIGRQTLGTAHPDYAIRLSNLAGLLRATGRPEDAEPLYREALEIDRQTVGDRHPVYAQHLSNLAGLLSETGRFAEAERRYREALEIVRQTKGDMHPDYATLLNNLGMLLADRNRHTEAEVLYREAIEIDRQTIGESHPAYATDLSNLAIVLTATGKHASAEPLFREALDVFETALGKDHPKTMTAARNLETFLASRP